MSHVTDIILSTMIEDGYQGANFRLSVDTLNDYLSSNYGGCKLVKVDDKAGGGKAMQCDLFIAAINHMNIPDFISAFREVDWEAPEYVQLMLKDEHDERFKIYTPQI